MSIGHTQSVALQGITGIVVSIEADCGPGLPGLSLVGLGDTAVSEAKDRIRSAARNSGLEWPKTKVVVSLSPASLPKNGSGYDLALVCAVLAHSTRKQEVRERLAHTVLLGELGLDGSLHPIRGVLPAVLAARDAGIAHVVVPAENAEEASLVSGVHVWAARSLTGAWHWVLTGCAVPGGPGSSAEYECWPCAHVDVLSYPGGDTAIGALDMADVLGQLEARRGLEIAAAGGHHMVMIGPPGSGKSMLAARLPSILPALSEKECLEVTAVHSMTGHVAHAAVVNRPPFINPHYSISQAALLGGGSGVPKPGAVSLAHHGVLFLDEVGEMKGGVLDSLRTPLEQGYVRIVRNRHDVIYPAVFQLVLAANPCPCGAETAAECRCDGRTRARYLSSLSGPLLDRMDIAVTTEPNRTSISAVGKGESSRVVRARVTAARELAQQRWQHHGLGAIPNSRVPGTWIRDWLRTDSTIAAYIDHLLQSGQLTQRGVDRTCRVAMTIADLESVANCPQGTDAEPASRLSVTLDHIDEACELHAGVEDAGR